METNRWDSLPIGKKKIRTRNSMEMDGKNADWKMIKTTSRTCLFFYLFRSFSQTWSSTLAFFFVIIITIFFFFFFVFFGGTPPPAATNGGTTRERWSKHKQTGNWKLHKKNSKLPKLFYLNLPSVTWINLVLPSFA